MANVQIGARKKGRLIGISRPFLRESTVPHLRVQVGTNIVFNVFGYATAHRLR